MIEIAALSEKAYTPELILRNLLARVDTIDKIAVSYTRKDGTYETEISYMSSADLSALTVILTRRAVRAWDADGDDKT